MKYLLTLLVGVILGGVLVYFLFVGAPKARPLPGSPVGPPDPGGDPPSTALVTLDERFFNAVLGTIFQDLGPPTFPLQLTMIERDAPESPAKIRPAAFQGTCQNTIALLPQGSNVNTGVRFDQGKIMSALAFSGSYNVFGNCVNFNGWAQANIQLSFDQANQTLYGQINVEGVNLEGTSPVVGGIITPLVQAAINQRINPLEILRAPQLTLAMPVQATGGTLNARVSDVRAEVTDAALRLHITYSFSGVRGQNQG